jgi:hypothetical protein
MTRPFKDNYAFGLQVETKGGRKVIQHGGGIEGFNTELAYYPEDRLTVAVLANLNGQASADIASKLAAIAHGETVKLQAEPKQLSEKLGSQAAYPIFPETDRLFFLKVVAAEIEFLKDANGATSLVLHQNGREQNAPRISDKAEAAPPRKEIHIDPRILAQYAGVFTLSPASDITMTVEGDQLMTQIRGSRSFPYSPKARTNSS